MIRPPRPAEVARMVAAIAEVEAEGGPAVCPACFNGGPPHYRKCEPGWGFGALCPHYEPDAVAELVQLELVEA